MQATCILSRWGEGMHGWIPARTNRCHEAANFIETIQMRQGLQVCCPEEIAFGQGWIDAEQLERLAAPLLKNDYGKYLHELAVRGVVP